MIVVIVEDDPVLTHMESLIFPLMGDYVCRVFNSPRDVMRPGPWEPGEGGERVHVALIDYMLSDHYTGGDVLRYLKENHPNIRRVLTTAMPISAIPEDDLFLADAVVRKPWEPEHMVQMLCG